MEQELERQKKEMADLMKKAPNNNDNSNDLAYNQTQQKTVPDNPFSDAFSKNGAVPDNPFNDASSKNKVSQILL